MTRTRSTYLALAEDCCPRAVDYAEAGASATWEHFSAGTACHDILEGITRGRSVGEVVERLLTIGRVGVDAQPPLIPSAVFEGRDLAERWVAAHGVPVGEAEPVWSFREDWTPDPHGDWFGLRADLVTVVDDDGDEDTPPSRTVVVRDYKTSWAADASELETIQRRAQAVAAWSMRPDATHVRVEVASVRRLEVYGRTIATDDEELLLLRTWRDDLDRMIRALRHRGPDGRRLARPGAGCGGCPYVRSCDAAGTYHGGELDALLAEWGAAKARVGALESIARKATADGAVTSGGWVVEQVDRPKRTVSDQTARAVLVEWLERYGVTGERLDDAVTAWVDAVGGMSVTALEGVSKALHPGRGGKATRDIWTSERVEVVHAPVLTVRPADPT